MSAGSAKKQMSRQEWRFTGHSAGAGGSGEPLDCDAGLTPVKGEREGGLV